MILIRKRFDSAAKVFWIAVLVSFLTAYVSPVGALMTPSEEAKMGTEVLAQIKKSLPLVNDPRVVEYVNKVGRDILLQVGYRDFPFEFFVVDDGSLNAFAIPGGYVFINRGLIQIMDGESELAAVLSHEVGHVQARHIARRIEETTPLNIATMAATLLAILAGGGKAGGAIAVGAAAASMSYQLQYSRQNEEEADRLGMKYLADSGYDINGSVSVFKKMVQSRFMNMEGIPTYLSTHPGLNDRIVYMENTLSTDKYAIDTQKERATQAAFLSCKVRLIALYEDPKLGVNLLDELARKEGGALPHYGMGLLLERSRKVQEAMVEYEKAIRLDPSDSEYVTQMGMVCYATGNCARASEYLDRAVSLDPRQSEALLYLGRIALDESRFRDAQALLEKVLNLNPDQNEAYQYLGLAYGRDGKLALAHENYAIYFERTGDTRNALYHYDKALEYSGETPGRAQEIRQRIEKLKNKGKEDSKKPEQEGWWHGR
ncbi:MAG: M48 family metalloprotease [Deltaproteobacteria bacterium]|nr:M48 family metalloprotease [Deltaproteobacteria bacterium]